MSDHNIFQRKLELKKHSESMGATSEKVEDRPISAEERLAWNKGPETEIPKEPDENDSQAVSLDEKGLNLKTGQVWLDKENKKWEIGTEISYRDGFIRGRCSNDTSSFSIITGWSYHRSVQLVSRCEEPVVDTLNLDGCISGNLSTAAIADPTPQDVSPHSVAFYVEIPEIGGNSKEHLDLIRRNITKLQNELRWQRKYEDMAIEQILSK